MNTLPQEQTIDINDMRMYYQLQGQGEPLLLLHGFLGSSKDWTLFTPNLEKTYRLIIPDLRGHGRSTNPSQAFTFRQAALDLFALLDHLGIEHCKAIGISGGGITLLHMATQQPERVEAMALVSATSYFPEQARKLMGSYTIESRTEQEWQFMRQSHPGGDEQIEALWRYGQGFKDSYDDVNFTPPYLSTITARTLIVYGDRDPLYPVQIAVDMYHAIPQAYLWILPNAGHSPVFTSQRTAFLQTVLSFLSGEWKQI
ncbi:MAG TPA: alpha/beta hydrolase [Ktedonobacteraceae bacterium]|jgi:pimeloyl-ACP methyl ester carboxylesterase|nr:alpha/beta hydrolase [Ktedonobacteraceae bacterium]